MEFTKTDMKMFKKAEQVSLISDYRRVRVGCVAVYHGRILAMAANSCKTHPVQQHFDQYRNICEDKNYQAKMHGETKCLNQIRHLDIDFSKIKLYIYRSCKDRPHGLAKPCKSCEQYIRNLGIKNVYYTTDIGYAYEQVL